MTNYSLKTILKQLENAQHDGSEAEAQAALESLRDGLKDLPDAPDALLIAVSSFAAETGRTPAISLPKADELNWILPVFSEILFSNGVIH